MMLNVLALSHLSYFSPSLSSSLYFVQQSFSFLSAALHDNSLWHLYTQGLLKFKCNSRGTDTDFHCTPRLTATVTDTWSQDPLWRPSFSLSQPFYRYGQFILGFRPFYITIYDAIISLEYIIKYRSFTWDDGLLDGNLLLPLPEQRNGHEERSMNDTLYSTYALYSGRVRHTLSGCNYLLFFVQQIPFGTDHFTLGTLDQYDYIEWRTWFFTLNIIVMAANGSSMFTIPQLHWLHFTVTD